MYQGSIYLLHKIERALKIFISDFYRPDGTTAVRVMPISEKIELRFDAHSDMLKIDYKDFFKIK